jgi:hypothetical protein
MNQDASKQKTCKWPATEGESNAGDELSQIVMGLRDLLVVVRDVIKILVEERGGSFEDFKPVNSGDETGTMIHTVCGGSSHEMPPNTLASCRRKEVWGCTRAPR